MDLFVLASPDIPFEHNAIRGSEEEREVMHRVFARALAESGDPYVEVYGSVGERCAQVMSALELLSASASFENDPTPSHA